MNKIIVTEFLSLDGVMEGPGPGDPFELAGWTVPYVNEQFMKFKAEELFASGALLLGRNTYDGFAKAWPTMSHTKQMEDMAKMPNMAKMSDAPETPEETSAQSNPFADKMNSMPKYVVSSTLTNPTWENTRVVAGDVVAGIKELKKSAEGDLLVCGSSVLIQTLMEHQLVNEYRFLVYPVVLGKGKKLFKDDEQAKLTLIEATAFETGVVLLRYSA